MLVIIIFKFYFLICAQMFLEKSIHNVFIILYAILNKLNKDQTSRKVCDFITERKTSSLILVIVYSASFIILTPDVSKSRNLPRPHVVPVAYPHYTFTPIAYRWRRKHSAWCSICASASFASLKTIL